MNYETEKWIELLERIEKGTATDEDLRKYSTWCDSFQQNRSEDAPVVLSGKQKENLFLEISKRTQRKPNQIFFSWKSASAIAGVLICFCAAIYWAYIQRDPENINRTEKELPRKATIIESGTRLVLENGDQIELGKEKNGFIGMNAIGTISKNGDNSLLYNVGTNKAVSALVYNKLITSRGHQYQVTLADGSKVWLNASSTLRFPVSFTGQKERRVFLEGEAYFEVAKSASVPFFVVTDNQEIKVLGTHFNVKSDRGSNGSATTLLEGAVRVNNAINLAPGEQLKVTQSGMRKSKVDVTEAIAWKNGYFLFDGIPFSDVMAELERWYDFDVEFKGSVPLDKIDATISRKKSLVQVLQLLEMTGSVKFSRSGNKVLVQETK